MTQLELPAPTEREVQEAELGRVADHLEEFIVEWCRRRWRGGQSRFHGDDLVEAVKGALGGASGSPMRVLRGLRSQGRVAYRVVNRAQSLYELERAP